MSADSFLRRCTPMVVAWRWTALATVAVAAGIWLRLSQIRTQILIDDEWHALHKLLHAGARDIATHFGYADYSIPLTLYYRALFDAGLLSEWSMRAPLVLAGIALLIVAAWLLRGWTDGRVRALLTGLLALSPLHVYLSRTARPYALNCLLGFSALIAFRRWWRRESGANWWAGAYAIATIAAGWLHILTLVFTLMPFVYYGIHALGQLASPASRPGGWHAIRRLLLLGVAVALPLTMLLVPPLFGDWNALAAKAGDGHVTWHSVWRTLVMLYGVGSSPVAIVLVALTAIGARRVWRRDRGLVGYLAVTGLIGCAAILAAEPAWIQHQAALARYALPILPFLALFLAEGIIVLLDALRARSAMAGIDAVAGACLLALLFAAGPIPRYLYDPNQFMGHARYMFDYAPSENPYEQQWMRPSEPMPAFYQELALLPPRSVTLVEAPWRLESNYIPEAWYQRIHRQYVKMGMVTGVCGTRTWGEYPLSTRGIHLANAVHLESILRGDSVVADYLVIRPKPWTIPPSDRDLIEWPDMQACLPKIEAKLGKPVYRDAQILVFTLPNHP